MSFRRPWALLIRSLVIAMILFQAFAFNSDDWIFVGFYTLAAAVALWYRAWLAVAAAVSVAVVRSTVALEIGGHWFHAASIAFAALFFALVVAYAQQLSTIRRLVSERGAVEQSRHAGTKRKAEALGVRGEGPEVGEGPPFRQGP